MEFLQYLEPAELSAKVLIAIQWGLFLVWASFIVKNIFNLRRLKSEIESCENVGSLADMVRQSLGGGEQSGAREEAPERKTIGGSARQIDTYFTVHNVAKKSPLREHLQAIFNAGLQGATIDVSSLIANTNNRIGRKNNSLRSVLSLFIILGLLGTLVGLAATLSHLYQGEGQLTSDLLQQNLQEVLARLGSAFAPSIWGVILTIFGVLLFFSFYLRLFSVPVSDLLERYTLTNWAPNLLPTPNELMVERLQMSEKTLRANMEGAQAISNAAPKLKEEIQGLEEKIEAAGFKFKALDDAAAKLIDFAKAFNESHRRLPEFQNELRTFGQTITDDSKLLKTAITNTLDGNSEFQVSVKDHFTRQNDFFNRQYSEQGSQLQNILNTLKLYEEGYLEKAHALDGKIEEMLTAARQAFEQISAQNQAIIDGFSASIGEPLRESVVEKLGGIEPALAGIEGTLKKLGNPIMESAEKISATMSHFDSRTDTILKNLHHNFTEQIDQLRSEFKAQEGKMEIQLENLQSLNSSISKLITEFGTLGAKIEKVNLRAASDRSAPVRSKKGGTTMDGDERRPVIAAPPLSRYQKTWERVKDIFVSR